jgi:hypothetical protein
VSDALDLRPLPIDLKLLNVLFELKACAEQV